MIKKLNFNEIMFSDFLIEQPVGEFNKTLSTRTSKNKIILASGRGTGKSVILKKRELDSIATPEPAICIDLFAPGLVGAMKNKYFNDNIIKYYYQSVMDSNLLQYVKRYYPELYYSDFLSFEEPVQGKMDELYKRLISGPYTKIDYNANFLFEEIISNFREKASADEITLIIDRFDWIHNSDPRVQEVLKGYFDLADKVIITSDDSKLSQDERFYELSDKGFEVLNFGYFSDPKVIKQIIERRFTADEENGERLSKFPVEDIALSDYQKLIDKTGGNISTMIDIIGDVESQHYWRKGAFDMTAQLDLICANKMVEVKKAEEMYPAKTLHL